MAGEVIFNSEKITWTTLESVGDLLVELHADWDI
jgi:hypothetical protein